MISNNLHKKPYLYTERQNRQRLQGRDRQLENGMLSPFQARQYAFIKTGEGIHIR